MQNPKLKINLGYLYGDLMNIYGDRGNIICLKERAKWRGIEVKIVNISLGAKLIHPSGGIKPDLYFFGGGQDQAQKPVARDLISTGKGKILRSEVERGIPLLAICGGYQLLGEYYKPHKGPKLEGTGLFPAYTLASFDRMIGNIVIQLSAISYQLSDEKQKKSDDRRLMAEDYLVGFENHSGKTYLNQGGKPLGRVIKGFGNNGSDGTEGCVYHNAIGCYMHGSLLPKNPALADWLISKAIETKYKKVINLKPLDDNLENKAHDFAVKKFS